MPAFLLKNPPATGLGILLLVALIACGLQSLRLANTRSELAGEKLAFSDFKKDLAEQSLKVEQVAAAKSDEQLKTLKTAIDSVNSIGTQTKTEIRYVQSNGGPCTADPAWRATVGGVQRILDAGNPGGDQSKAGSGSASPVRGASAPRPK